MGLQLCPLMILLSFTVKNFANSMGEFALQFLLSNWHVNRTKFLHDNILSFIFGTKNKISAEIHNLDNKKAF